MGFRFQVTIKIDVKRYYHPAEEALNQVQGLIRILVQLGHIAADTAKPGCRGKRICGASPTGQSAK